MKKGSIGAENFVWDLSIFYSGIEDPQIEKDLIAFEEKAKAFKLNYESKVAQNLGIAILDYAALESVKVKIGAYFFLKESENVADGAVKAKKAEIERKLYEIIGNNLVFFEIEVANLEDSVVDQLLKDDPIVARYESWIEKQRLLKPHLLEKGVESALVKRAVVGSNSWGDFFDEVESDLVFGEEKKTLHEMLNILEMSKDAEERARVLSDINTRFKGYFSKYSAQTLSIVTQAMAIEVKERGYKHPMDSANKSNSIPDSVVDVLHEVVRETAGPLVRRFYRLKASLIGKKVLAWSDRNAPISLADTTIIPFPQALEIIKSAYRSFSPTFAQIVDSIINNKRIHAPFIKGKRGGAFNYSTVFPDNRSDSFILMSYFGSAEDVVTLAHELGHGVHGILAGEKQGILMSDPPTAYCETASIFGEMITFDFLRKEIVKNSSNPTAVLSLLIKRIGDNINTIVRQIGFSNFERMIHGMDPSYQKWEEVKKLSVEELNRIWLKTLKELYGEEGDVFTYKDVDLLWAYISHFHRPFYVYSYSFGNLLTQGLIAQSKKMGDKFEPLYLDLLSSGSTKNVFEMLEPFGLNPAEKSFWVDGIQSGIGSLLEEAEETAKSLNICLPN